MASFLYCFPYSYRSSNFCDSNKCRSFTLLKALAKSNGNHFANAFKSENEPLKKNQRTDTKRDAKGLRMITLKGAIEKSPILLSQYWKNYYFKRVTKIISHFDGSNNIFVDYSFILICILVYLFYTHCLRAPYS